MEKVKIKLIGIGDIYPVKFEKLNKLSKRSRIVEFCNNQSIPNPEILNNEIYTLSLKNLDFLKLEDIGNNDFIFAIVKRPLEREWLSFPISRRIVIASIFDLDSLNLNEGITCELYLYRMILGFATIYKAYKEFPDKEIVFKEGLMQYNTTGCLFDHAHYKPEIAVFFRNPHLSPPAKCALQHKTLPPKFIEKLEKEIYSLKIGSYFRIKKWIRDNPIWGLCLTFLFGIISAILSSYIYDFIKKL